MKKFGLVLGLAALLSIGAVAGTLTNEEVTSTSALAGTVGDVELDICVNFKTVNQADATYGAYPDTLHWISANDGNVSKGDSFALRMRNNTPIDIWFTFYPNLGVVAFPKPNYTGYKQYTWVNGVQGTTTARTWYFETRLPANFDGWLFLPKSAFTISKNGDTPLTADWTVGAWAYYFGFYGANDYIDVDLGTVATGNYQTGEILTRLIDWTHRNGLEGVTDDWRGTMLAETRNNENLKDVVNFYNAIKNVDACNQAACQAVVEAQTANFGGIRNDAAKRAYFQSLKVTDYDDGDLLHEGGKTVTYTLQAKWAQIQATAAGSSSAANLMLVNENDSKNMVLVFAGAIAALAVSLFFFFKKKRA